MGKAFGMVLIAAAAWYLVETYVQGHGPSAPEVDGARSTAAQRAGASVERSMQQAEQRYLAHEE